MAKKVVGYIKLQVKAGQANPSPPVGPASQRSLNIMEFCKGVQCRHAEAGARPADPGGHHGLLRPYLHVHHQDAAGVDPAEKKAVGITSGSKRPNTDKVGKVTRQQLEDIAKAKEPDLTAADLDAAVRTIAGSAVPWAWWWRVKTMALNKRQKAILAATQPGKALRDR